ncbi:hypothetical protein B0J13DRAFT_288626 [Dactylonectria estremocensis]|uniref:Uncharacterized protein n=1 Tax=Dactylonectria estremocensis TaxID=1079267 RepID=A0A9P9J6T2_9HYPO|nr:hypothetical protein B0J13DRAFT_288626 [Dactylonectria estremocensis]
MPSQRPYFLSSFLAAFRPQGPTMAPTPQHQHHQQPKHPRDAASTSVPSAVAASATHQQTASSVAIRPPRGAAANAAVSPAATSQGTAIPIPGSSRRRGSDSSSEGFRDVIGADKWYIGGRTPSGEEKFFKLGVIRRVRSNDGLSLDRLSL